MMKTNAVAETMNGINPPLQTLLTAYKTTGLGQQPSNMQSSATWLITQQLHL
jgi:hypothetical protein